MAVYQVVALPKLPHYDLDDPQVNALASKFRELRLFALQSDPDAFGSSYHDEVQRNLKQTADRLGNPQDNHFVAIERRPDDTSTGTGTPSHTLPELLDAKWVGMIVLVHGHAPRSFAAAEAAGDQATSTAVTATKTASNSTEATSATTFHLRLGGTFVHPDARGHGLGRALVVATIDKARALREGKAGTIMITVLANKENDAACQLYVKTGFHVVGDESYMQRTWSHDKQLVEVPRVATKMEMLL